MWYDNTDRWFEHSAKFSNMFGDTCDRTKSLSGSMAMRRRVGSNKLHSHSCRQLQDVRLSSLNNDE